MNVAQSRALRGPYTQSLMKAEFVSVQIAVALAPFLLVRVPGILLTASDLFFMLSLGLRVLTGQVPMRPLGAVTPIWLAGVVMLMGGLLVSSVVDGDAVRGIVVSLQYYFGLICLPLAVLARPIRQVNRLMLCGLVGMILVCCIGFLSLILGDGIASQEAGTAGAGVTGNGRLVSLLADANTLAALVAMTVPTLAYLYLVGALGVIWTAVAMAILVVTVVLASSNSGILAFAVACGILVAGRISIGTIAVAAILGALGAVVFMNGGEALLPAVFVKRVLGFLTSGDISQAGTFNERLQLMKDALAVIPDHMWIGLGADQFRESRQDHVPVHNLYLLLWVEGGFISLVGWLVILSSAVFAGMIHVKRKGDSLGFLIVLSATAVLAMLAMTFPHMYARHYISPIVLALSPLAARRTQIPGPSAAVRWPVAALPQPRPAE